MAAADGDDVKLPPPDGWRSRVVHGAMSLATLPLAARYGGPVPEVRLAEPRARAVAVPGGALHTLEWGAVHGRPTVLVHGLNANARYWTGTACMLAPGRRILAPDLRYHGATGPLPGGVGLADTRADLAAWLDALALERVDLVGHSWGGKVALDLAAAHPARVRRLALVDPVPPQGLHWVIRHGAWVAGAVFAPERGPFADAAALARARSRIAWLRHAPPWMLGAFDANFRARPDGALHPVLPPAQFDAIYHDVLGRPSPLPLGGVTMPVLVVRATYSAMPFRAQLAWLRRQLPQLRTTHVAGEHSLHATNPVALALALAAFLDG